MRRLIGIAALALLGTALLVSTALAVVETGGTVNRKDNNRQVTKIGGSSPTDSIVYGAKVTPTGSLQVSVESPASSMVLIQPSWITTRFVYGADGVSTGWTSPKCLTVDSTSVPTQTLGYTRLALLVYPQFDNLIAAAQFAIQVNGHQYSSTDTLSSFAWSMTHPSRSGGPDSLNSLLDFKATRIQFGSGGDDTLLTTPGERIFFIGPNLNTHSGILIPLKDTDGTWISAPYISIRWRIMNTFGSAFTAYGQGAAFAFGSPAVTQAGVATEKGTSGASTPRTVILRADLVGWRE